MRGESQVQRRVVGAGVLLVILRPPPRTRPQRYWAAQGCLDDDPSGGLRCWRPPDHTRALSRVEVEALLARHDVGLGDKTLCRMPYETAALIGEVLSLDVEDLNLCSHQARIRRRGGAADVIVWQTGTARLLPRVPITTTELARVGGCVKSES